MPPDLKTPLLKIFCYVAENHGVLDDALTPPMNDISRLRDIVSHTNVDPDNPLPESEGPLLRRLVSGLIIQSAEEVPEYYVQADFDLAYSYARKLVHEV